jgi:hypothetical protein
MEDTAAISRHFAQIEIILSGFFKLPGVNLQTN